MAQDLTKLQRRQLRELAGLAHDRELSAELAKLEDAFRRWRSGEIDPHQLNDLIHAFHQGPSRKLFSRYTDSNKVLSVADAVARGVVAETELPEGVLSVLRSSIAFFRDNLESAGDDEP